MKFAREVWSPAEMCAMFSFYILDPPTIPDPTWAAGERILRPWIGWITYLPPNLAARAKYPSDVEVEGLEDGARWCTFYKEPFKRATPKVLAVARARSRAASASELSRAESGRGQLFSADTSAMVSCAYTQV